MVFETCSVRPPHPARPQYGIPVLGLIGGIGSGKSAIARHWAETASAVVIEGDAAGHDVLKDPAVQKALRREFGDGVFEHEGHVNRRALAGLVFGADERRTEARKKLEAIVHPHIERLLAGQIAAARQRGGCPAIILDAALLLETGWRELCDAVIFVECPWPLRLQRVQARGWSEAQLRDRETSQLPLDVKRTEADYVLQNSTNDYSLPPLDSVLSALFP